MRNKLFFFLAALFLFPAVLRAEDVTTALVLEVKNAQEDSSVKVDSTIVSESGSTVPTPVTTYSDLKSNVTSVSILSKYIAATKTFEIQVQFQKKSATGAAQKPVTGKIACALESGQDKCVAVGSEDGVYSAQIECSLAKAATVPATVKSVNISVTSEKRLNNTQSGSSKVLEEAQVTSTFELGKEALLYSDSKTDRELNVLTSKDAKNNVWQNFKGKDGEISLNVQSGFAATINLSGKAAPTAKFERRLSTETKLGDTPAPQVVPSRATMNAIAVRPAGKEGPDQLDLNSSIALDAKGLKPDPAQENYEAGKGLFVIELPFTTEDNQAKSIKGYWDIGEATATDVTAWAARTNIFTFVADGQTRTIKARASTSGEVRSFVQFAESNDFDKNDQASVEFGYTVGN